MRPLFPFLCFLFLQPVSSLLTFLFSLSLTSLLVAWILSISCALSHSLLLLCLHTVHYFIPCIIFLFMYAFSFSHCGSFSMAFPHPAWILSRSVNLYKIYGLSLSHQVSLSLTVHMYALFLPLHGALTSSWLITNLDSDMILVLNIPLFLYSSSTRLCGGWNTHSRSHNCSQHNLPSGQCLSVQTIKPGQSTFQ